MAAALPLSSFDIWPATNGRLAWYRAVADNEAPAKYLVAASVPAQTQLHADQEELWQAHGQATDRVLPLQHRARQGKTVLTAAELAEPNLLDLKAAIASQMLGSCRFCAWDCKVDRHGATKLGTCKLDGRSRVSSAFHHRGEELVFQGSGGSGTVFFTSCNLRCAFCQNGDISTDKDNGTILSSGHVAALARRLRYEGVHNLNLVGGEPTIHLHTILGAIALLHGRGIPSEDSAQVRSVHADRFRGYDRFHEQGTFEGRFNVPILWNSNFYMSAQTMELLHTVVDVWLPDFKFGPGRCAIRLARTPRYWETITRNLSLIEGWGEDYVVRHLVMPDHLECCTFPILEWLGAHAPGALVNIMGQYHPDCRTDPSSPDFDTRLTEMTRRPNRREMRLAYRKARDVGLIHDPVTYH